MMTRVLVHLEAEFMVSSGFPSHADLRNNFEQPGCCMSLCLKSVVTDNANDQSLNSRKENIRCAMSRWIGYAWVRMQI